MEATCAGRVDIPVAGVALDTALIALGVLTFLPQYSKMHRGRSSALVGARRGAPAALADFYRGLRERGVRHPRPSSSNP